MTLCMTLYVLFRVLFVYIIFAVLVLTVHLCAIDTRFNKCNLFTYLLYMSNIVIVTFLSAANETVSQVSDADFDKLMNYDDKCFVRPGSARRREFISRWIKIPGGRALMAVNHRGDVIGYGCRNPDAIRSKVHFIAPLYADSYEVASDLIHELSRDIVGETIVIHIR